MDADHLQAVINKYVSRMHRIDQLLFKNSKFPKFVRNEYECPAEPVLLRPL